MKKILLILAFMVGAITTSYSDTLIAEASEQTVYICTGSSSKRYHKTNKCKGLRNCGGRIIAISKAEAEDMGRTPCQICY